MKHLGRGSARDVELALRAAAGRRRRTRRGRRSTAARWLLLLPVAALAALAAGGVLLVSTGAANALIASDCSLRSMRPISLGENSFVYAANGARLGAIASNLHRQPLTLASMSPWLPKATVAIEDRRFWQHGGLDYVGIARAAVADVEAGHIVEGGSTIEQELARNLYLGNDPQTLSWKLTQACLAVKIARRWTKPQILDAYLNQVDYGSHAYGVAAAARTYFARPASQLTLPETALIAGLPQAPSRYDPFVHPQAALARRDEVLRALLRAGQIRPATYRAAVELPLELRPGTLYTAVNDRGFVGFVQQQLVARFGSRTVGVGGLTVQTTLLPRLQRAARLAERAVLLHPGDPAAALVAIDPQTGAIRAMTTFQPGRPSIDFNIAADGHRQAGSAFKPFVLATALERGYTLQSGFVGPASYVVADPRCDTGNQPWLVHNYAGEWYGYIPLSTAIADSVNTVFAQLVDQVGPANVVVTAHRAGIVSPLQAVCSITLGTQPVTPLEMADAYATFAAGGVHHPAQAIESVRTAAGRQIAALDTQGTQAMPSSVAAAVTQALQGVVQYGTGTAAAIPGFQVAGKTGTAEHEEDAWFCGYAGGLATCVWVGFPAGEIPMHDIEGVPAVVGGSLAAEIWHGFMTAALTGPSAQA